MKPLNSRFYEDLERLISQFMHAGMDKGQATWCALVELTNNKAVYYE